MTCLLCVSKHFMPLKVQKMMENRHGYSNLPQLADGPLLRRYDIRRFSQDQLLVFGNPLSQLFEALADQVLQLVG